MYGRTTVAKSIESGHLLTPENAKVSQKFNYLQYQGAYRTNHSPTKQEELLLAHFGSAMNLACPSSLFFSLHASVFVFLTLS